MSSHGIAHVCFVSIETFSNAQDRSCSNIFQMFGFKQAKPAVPPSKPKEFPVIVIPYEVRRTILFQILHTQ